MSEQDDQLDAIYKALLLSINQYYGLSLKFVSRTIYSDFTDVFGKAGGEAGGPAIWNIFIPLGSSELVTSEGQPFYHNGND